MKTYDGLEGTDITPKIGDVTNVGTVIEVLDDGRIVTDKHRQGSFHPATVKILFRVASR